MLLTLARMDRQQKVSWPVSGAYSTKGDWHNQMKNARPRSLLRLMLYDDVQLSYQHPFLFLKYTLNLDGANVHFCSAFVTEVLLLD